MFLVRLIYASRINPSFKPDDMGHILESARKHNRSVQITGMLYFNRKMFLQCIEGPREAVNELYNKISLDKRHANLTLLSFCEIDERVFADWSMGYIPENKLTDVINLKFAATPNFNPLELSGERALKLMIALQKTMGE